MNVIHPICDGINSPLLKEGGDLGVVLHKADPLSRGDQLQILLTLFRKQIIFTALIGE